MAGPFDDQAVLDLTESLQYTAPGGSATTWENCTLDDVGMQTVQTGLLSLVAREIQVTVSLGEAASRPAPGGTIEDSEATYTIVSVLKRKPGNFWEITARNFNVPGGLTERSTLRQRVSTAATATGLNDPTWTVIASDIPCRVLQDGQGAEFGETPVDTLLTARVFLAGYREVRAGQRWTHSTAPTVHWNVDGAEPYDPSIGVQILNISRRV